jgi:hypothetical protein
MTTVPALAALTLLAAASAQQRAGPVADHTRVLEVRSYNLKAGTRDRFHGLFLGRALPLLKKWKVDVVAFGPSLHDRDSWMLMRAFDSLDDRTRIEDAFYGSDEWRNGPRADILAAIESYTTIVIRVDDTTLRGLRMPTQTDNRAADLEALLRLNNDYIDSVRTSNLNRFRQILADDFLCTLPDGTLIDRAEFLEHTARPATIGNLEVHDVNVRVMDDFAIVHARTTFTQAGGAPGAGRYTDVWARRNGQWVAVAAHVTRR